MCAKTVNFFRSVPLDRLNVIANDCYLQIVESGFLFCTSECIFLLFVDMPLEKCEWFLDCIIYSYVLCPSIPSIATLTTHSMILWWFVIVCLILAAWKRKKTQHQSANYLPHWLTCRQKWVCETTIEAHSINAFQTKCSDWGEKERDRKISETKCRIEMAALSNVPHCLHS